MNRDELIKRIRLKKEIKSRKARQDLLKFIKYTMPNYHAQWFHVLICEKLEALLEGKIKKLMIFIPPQHGKSQISSRHFPAYALGRNPKEKVAVCSYSPELAQSFNRSIQLIMDEKEYIELFPKTRLNSSRVSTNTKGELRNSSIFEIVGEHGYCRTVGIGQALTGTSVGLGIIDDPFKDRESANSQSQRDKVWAWYQDVFLTRLPDEGRQLMLFTRWHEDDLAGRILDPNNKHYDPDEAKEWEVIAIPAIKEDEKVIESAMDINDPRETGEALWEEKHGKAKYEKMEKINPVGYNSLAQQRPTALGGNIIKGEWFEVLKESELPFNPDQYSAQFIIDGAFTDKTKNDESATLSYYIHKGIMYVKWVDGCRKELPDYLKHFRRNFRLWGGKPNSTVNIEKKASGHPIGSMLSTFEYGNYNVTYVSGKWVRLGKYNRVESSAPFMASGKVKFIHGSYIPSFVSQMESFPNGAHDDKLDTLCYAVLEEFMQELDEGGTDYDEY